VARDTNRGHTVAAVKDCFVLAKDAGFKVGGAYRADVMMRWLPCGGVRADNMHDVLATLWVDPELV